MIIFLQIESVQTILTCTDLEVKGTGKSAISVTEVHTLVTII